MFAEASKQSLPQRCSVTMKALKERQGRYIKKLSQLNHVEIIDSLPAFCTLDGLFCSPLDRNKKLLYADSHHLSQIGSQRQFDEVIRPYFD